ncbi:lysyl oxidase family protein [Lentzea sp. NEAU-D7]|uniref:lysyl oxidase family protein n=1 Tax=Lentzea sp. NEAU-D7 TaxID=2994667 RepID=UPI00224B5859|nr:lysyl oxidase family protein [Lentzea sp. NEAU-D7]MCX2952735.1 lysyl oxidase family protein [Lentzea sp. NEAU-D7]
MVSRIGAVIAALTFTAVNLVSSQHVQADPAPLLPDLRQAPIGCPGGHDGSPLLCRAWDVCLVEDASAPRGKCMFRGGTAQAVRLRFTTSIDNVGDGPLLLHAHRDSTATPTMDVRQAIQSGVDGSIAGSYNEARRETRSSAYYEPAPTHTHWHLLNFEYFQLRAPDGKVVVTDRKNGFCIGDRYTVSDDLPRRPSNPESPEGKLAQRLDGHMCEHHNPSALDVMFGISVGSGDDYKYDVDFQWLDLTHVKSGVYDVVNVVNSDRALLEKNYDNNASSIAISVQWPDNAVNPPSTIEQAPSVRMIRSCPGKARCAKPGS